MRSQTENNGEVPLPAPDLNDAEIELLLDFFRILDEWDREEQSRDQLKARNESVQSNGPNCSSDESA